jgi:hypothetical protein
MELKPTSRQFCVCPGKTAFKDNVMADSLAGFLSSLLAGSCTFRERIIPALRKTGKIPS